MDKPSTTESSMSTTGSTQGTAQGASSPNASSLNKEGSNREAIVDQAKHAVTHLAEQAKEQVGTQLNTKFDAGRSKAVEAIGSVAEAVRGTSSSLKGVGPLGDVAERAADGIERFANYFEGKQVGDVVNEIQQFARREPALFLGSTFLLGLVGGRFLKSSAHRSAGGERMYSGQGSSQSGQSGRNPSFRGYADDSMNSEDMRQNAYGASRSRQGSYAQSSMSQGRSQSRSATSDASGRTSMTETTGQVGTERSGPLTGAQSGTLYGSSTPVMPATQAGTSGYGSSPSGQMGTTGSIQGGATQAGQPGNTATSASKTTGAPSTTTGSSGGGLSGTGASKPSESASGATGNGNTGRP